MAAATLKISDGTEIENWDEYLETLIDVFKPVLLDTMRVSHLVPFLDIEEIKDKAGIIHQKENSGDFKGAARDLLDCIKNSNQPGRWQMLIDALREVEDTVILQILLEERSQKWLTHDENRRIISIFSSQIIDYLNLPNLLNKMVEKNLILPADQQRLQSLTDAGRKQEANGALLFIMHRHSDDWYDIFMGILCDCEHHHGLAESIDAEFCIKRENAQAQAAGGEPHSSPSAPQHGQHVPLSEGDRAELGSNVNLAGKAQTGDKGMAGKSVPLGDVHHSEGDQTWQASASGEVMAASCGCQCCAQLLSKMTSMESELGEMKDLVRTLVRKFQDAGF
ncbi:uncharacterized protein LOC143294989 [Babylonia areolata]|uniref:uncharacterized protein LOC143294989 n=1 Tax=Babylonia areolata TaxID=304850 RepID=UPI003FD14549